jgi:formylglycine-generating enzyme required for sulfatase activity
MGKGFNGVCSVLLAVFLFSGCDLLNNKPEVDLEKKMDDAVAYANAADVQQIKTKTHNQLGLYNMSGNVDEWCFYYAAVPPGFSFVGAVVMGGYYNGDAEFLQVGNTGMSARWHKTATSARSSVFPYGPLAPDLTGTHDTHTGFRIVRTGAPK